MGHASRTKKTERDEKYARRWAWLKALTGFFLVLPSLPILVAYTCWKDNEWPWKGFNR